jgi:predicted cobalt transporter CbtA
MMRTLLVRGLLAGLVAGVLAFVFAKLFGEPSVVNAIDFESAEHARDMAGMAEEPELVSRAVQSTIGLATGILVYAVAFGGLFAVAFGMLYGRLGRLSPRTTALLLAAGGFVAVFLVPFLKYPGNPPAVGQGETIGERTTLYWTMLIGSVLLAIGAVYLGRTLTEKLGAWTAGTIALVAYVATAGVLAAVLPVIVEVPEHFPATVLWNFRVAALGIQLVMWTSMGLLFGALVHRPLTQAAERQELAAAL